MHDNIYKFEAIIEPASKKGGAYVRFPYDIRKEFSKGRVKVEAYFDSEIYYGSIVNMGVKNDDGSICYIIGIKKNIRSKINKDIGDKVQVSIKLI